MNNNNKKPSIMEDEIKHYQVQAKKKFGQNFLKDENVLYNIVDKAGIKAGDQVVEIGPGLGALTSKILEKITDSGKLLAYEIDNDLIPILTRKFDVPNFKLVHTDFLKSQLESDLEYFDKDKEIHVIANLPYYITTPIIFKILESKRFKSLTLMVQKEVAERITSVHNKKDYNSLSVAIQYQTNSRKLFDVSPNCFHPRPNVTSSIIKIDILPEPVVQVDSEEFFFKLVRLSFGQRRKTLVNNLVDLGISKAELTEILIDVDFNPSVRAEALSIQDFGLLSNILYSYFKNK